MATPQTRTHQSVRSTPFGVHTHTHTGGHGPATTHTYTGPGGPASSQAGGNSQAPYPGVGGGVGGPARGLFPPPPPYYQHYTHENLQLAAERQRLESEGHDPSAHATDHPLPPLAPPPPLTDAYSILSTSFHPTYVRPTLASAGIPTLTSTPPLPKPLEIRKLVLSAALQHARLLDALARDPQSEIASLAVDRLQAILVNAMHMLGEYREHQALETLRLAMDKTVWESRQVSTTLKGTEAGAREVIAQVLGLLHQGGGQGDKESEVEREAGRVVERRRRAELDGMEGIEGGEDQSEEVKASQVEWWARQDTDQLLWDAVKSV
ncbi:MED7 protein-domain-containing protein [Catenaria anguillulae PL171]|uniref:Mediator of RNA polymerase II transcription subunit 7 n=1 Tax=Catenaria anguillulae PL171 TaxID=765915 RepID=A0A1Y2I1H4_9FUNG|nr:MED7 protein-domain-containing protein [Catenaria anguillulae PL171]